MGWMRYSHKLLLDPAAETAPETLVMLLHDRGQSAATVEPIARRWAETVPTTAFMIPDGVEQPDRPPGDVASPSVIDPRHPPEWAEIDPAVRELDSLALRQLSRYGLERDQLVLVGIGHGGTLALHMSLRSCINYTSVLAIAGKLDRSLAESATSKGKVRLVLQPEGHAIGDGFMGEFLARLSTRGIDARGVLLSVPTLSETAIRYGAFYLSELVAAAQWRASPRFNRDPD